MSRQKVQVEVRMWNVDDKIRNYLAAKVVAECYLLEEVYSELETQLSLRIHVLGETEDFVYYGDVEGKNSVIISHNILHDRSYTFTKTLMCYLASLVKPERRLAQAIAPASVSIPNPAICRRPVTSDVKIVLDELRVIDEKFDMSEEEAGHMMPTVLSFARHLHSYHSDADFGRNLLKALEESDDSFDDFMEKLATRWNYASTKDLILDWIDPVSVN